MNMDTLTTAIEEAERFLDKAKRLKRVKTLDRRNVDEANQKVHAPHERRYYQDFPKDSGAVKRASMDLTRALADLRRPG